jgi:hypothetical protein
MKIILLKTFFQYEFSGVTFISSITYFVDKIDDQIFS